MPTELVRPLPGAQTFWTYAPSRPQWKYVPSRWLGRFKRTRGPDWHPVKAPASTQAGPSRWLLYFVFLPDGQLTPQHRFTLARLRAEDAHLMVVCACPPGHPVLDELDPHCDALCWKATAGYDFSAYAIGLHVLARHCPGTDVLVMNDSMLGPFRPLMPFMAAARWDLTGFAASAAIENHVQSYAFIVRRLDAAGLGALSPVLSLRWTYPDRDQAIELQETRLAHVASRHMPVGAFWFADGTRYRDLSLQAPAAMIEAGFPFLKRSLFGVFEGRFQDPVEMRSLLQRMGHPPLNAPA
ncbi:MAG: hypothetical protein R3E94_13305 [Burkholderiaceae bacterium]